MSTAKELKTGHFYWVLPVYDVDFVPSGFDPMNTSNYDAIFEASVDAWWQNEQPALYLGRAENGEDRWAYIGQDFVVNDWWPVRWIGEEIPFPKKA